MILVVNCFKEEAFAADFDQAVAGRLQGTGQPCCFLRAEELETVEDSPRWTHLIISGSVASATMDQPWDRPLAQLVHRFVAAGKPILGICYGHQFLAKVLAGPGHVRRAAREEFGFLKLRLADAPLFKGLTETVAVVSHFDEVFDLPGEFKVLASSGSCAVHAFQYRGLPVWGVQFHPEYGAEDSARIWKTVFCCTPERIPPPLEDPAPLQQNRVIFENFARSGEPPDRG
jgi:GMP synthase (glutamine-hydrolysing)